MSIRKAAELVRDVYRQTYGNTLVLKAPDPTPGESETPVQLDFKRMEALGFAPCAKWEKENRNTLRLCETHFQKISI